MSCIIHVFQNIFFVLCVIYLCFIYFYNLSYILRTLGVLGRVSQITQAPVSKNVLIDSSPALSTPF